MLIGCLLGQSPALSYCLRPLSRLTLAAWLLPSGSSVCGMPSCLPPRYRLLDLVFALWGTVAFLTDLGVDLWSAVKYYKGGERVLGGLHFGLYVLSSSVLQLLSWGWFWVDQQQWAPQHVTGSNGSPHQCGVNDMQSTEGGTCCELDDNMLPEDKSVWPVAANSFQLQEPAPRPAHHTAIHHTAIHHASDHTATPDEDYDTFLTKSHPSQLCLWPSCLSILHLLQLGYPFR